jgi:protein kinase-like protein
VTSKPAGSGTRRLGPYEFIGRIGAGGMGEVYRARDTRLGREVAIKLLPPEVSADADRLRRFEKEAQAASSLNHPNIVTIYEVERIDSTSFIVMELVDGKTLRDIVADGPLTVRKLLGIAVQIADGLARAHSAGIVHRDLKPENVMVTKEGLVKILDFGLAKLAHPGLEGGQEAEAPTVSAGTKPGIVMGTVGYMSPEQASGHPVDFRSDQFSFGALLYEMATAKYLLERVEVEVGRRAEIHGISDRDAIELVLDVRGPSGSRDRLYAGEVPAHVDLVEDDAGHLPEDRPGISRCGDLLHLHRVEVRSGNGLSRIDVRRGTRDADSLRDRRQFHRGADLRVLADGDQNRLVPHRGESGTREEQRVGPRRQIQKVEFASSVRFRRRRCAGTTECGDHAGDRPLLLVDDCSVEIANGKQVLARSARGQEQDSQE